MYRFAARPRCLTLLASCSLLSLLTGCPAKTGGDAADKGAVAAEDAKGEAAAKLKDPAGEFVRNNDAKLRELWVDAETKLWNQQTNINDENEKAASEAHERVMAYESTAIAEAARLLPQAKTEADKRQLELMTRVATLPAPNDDAKRKQLAGLASEMESIYGKGKFCEDPAKPETCRDLGALSDVLADSRDPKALLDAWQGWRSISTGKMREDYVSFAALGNEGARELGYKDMGELWRSKYDMSAAEFEAEMERLWKQVEPLYKQLHCHVRAKLNEKYGDGTVSKDGKIPAHLLGNMWAQEWANIYPLMEPFAGQPSIDVTQALEDKGFDELKMVRAAESFFTSLGLDALPKTFWERSMFKKPADRDVVCHASAWDVGLSNDLRIKMCIKINMEDLITIHHELGHNYYYHYYYQLPVLFQQGAHDGFHEGIGDTLALSVTPSYLKKIGLLDEASDDEKAVINKQMQDALDKIAFLPFGLLIDKWRWGVFSGDIKPENYNAAWWDLRETYQGIQAPVERSESDFDPGAKYHIPANTPYARYFLARILQFQFHKALCETSGHKGPLHTCSIYGSKEAGEKMQTMLAMGASKPWPDALEAVTGTRTMDAGPLIDYFAPLMGYLEEQNKGRTCGW